jgi:hypothetical protein
MNQMNPAEAASGRERNMSKESSTEMQTKLTHCLKADRVTIKRIEAEQDDLKRLVMEVSHYYLFRADLSKFENLSDLRWGCRLDVLWKDDVAFAKKEKVDPWTFADECLLIRFPGGNDDPWEGGIVWCMEVAAEKCKGDPAWVSINRLLTFKRLCRIRARKEGK